MNLRKLLAVLLLGSFSLNPSPALADSVSFQASPVDVYTPPRVDPALDILDFRAIERTTSPNGDWELVITVPYGSISTSDLTMRGTHVYGFGLDYNRDGRSDITVSTGYDPSPQMTWLRPYTLVTSSDTGQELCRGDAKDDVAIVVIDGAPKIRDAVSLRVPKSCLPSVPQVSMYAFTMNLDSSLGDLLPEGNWVSIRQPWIDLPAATLQVMQRTLASFSSTATALTTKQKLQVKAAVEANPNATKFICTGIRYVSQPLSENIKVRKRAKAACEYAKELNPKLSTWFQNKPTEARSYAGKVLLTIKSPAS